MPRSKSGEDNLFPSDWAIFPLPNIPLNFPGEETFLLHALLTFSRSHEVVARDGVSQTLAVSTGFGTPIRFLVAHNSTVTGYPHKRDVFFVVKHLNSRVLFGVR